MKLSILLSLLLVCFNTAAEDKFFSLKNAYHQPVDQGCTIKGKDKIFAVGSREQMNHKELSLYKEKTGYNPSDGYAVMMICLYLVDPNAVDHPKVKDRKYVWVAS